MQNNIYLYLPVWLKFDLNSLSIYYLNRNSHFRNDSVLLESNERNDIKFISLHSVCNHKDWKCIVSLAQHKEWKQGDIVSQLCQRPKYSSQQVQSSFIYVLQDHVVLKAVTFWTITSAVATIQDADVVFSISNFWELQKLRMTVFYQYSQITHSGVFLMLIMIFFTGNIFGCLALSEINDCVSHKKLRLWTRVEEDEIRRKYKS